MKIIFRILGVLLLLILIVVIAAPFLLEKNIDTIVRKTIKNQVNAQVNFSEIDLSLIRNFPKATIAIKDLEIINSAPFAGDTLVVAKEIDAELSITQLFKKLKKEITISKLTLDQADVTIQFNKEGKANFDIFESNETSTASPNEESTASNNSFNLNLDYEIIKSNFKYIDKKSHTFFALNELNHIGKGELSSSTTDLNTTTSTLVDFTMADISYLKNAPIDLTATIGLDLKNQKYTFKENTALVNHIPLAFSGFVQLLNENDTDIELEFVTKDAGFKNLLSALPNAYKKNIKGVRTKGKFDLHGSVKGISNKDRIPNLDLVLKTQNASFKYPDLPKGIEDISINANLTNTTGRLKDTHLDFSNFNIKIDRDSFSANGKITNMIDNPYIDVSLFGVLNLNNLTKAYPVELDTDLNGILNLNLSTAFTMSAIEKKDY